MGEAMNGHFLRALGRLTNNCRDTEEDDTTTRTGDTGHSDSTLKEYLGDSWRLVVAMVNSRKSRSQRLGDPINEITDRDILQKAFPTTFLFGETYPQKGVLLKSRQTQVHKEHRFLKVCESCKTHQQAKIFHLRF